MMTQLTGPSRPHLHLVRPPTEEEALDRAACYRFSESCWTLGRAAGEEHATLAQENDDEMDPVPCYAVLQSFELELAKAPSRKAEYLDECRCAFTYGFENAVKVAQFKTAPLPAGAQPVVDPGSKRCPAKVKENRYAVVKPGHSIRLIGLEGNHVHGPIPYDRTYQIGDSAEYDSFNLSYIGTITNIGPKTITITDMQCRTTHRLTIHQFDWRNWDGLESKHEQNANWTD